MLNRLLGQQISRPGILPPLRKTRLQRRPDQIIKHKRAINQQRKPHHLQPLETLPAERQTDNPDEQRAARVDDTPARRGDRSCDRQSEKVEPADAEHDGDARERDDAVIQDLPVPLGGVEVAVAARPRRPNREVQQDLADDRGAEAEEALPRDDLEGLERVGLEDPLFDAELRGGEDLREGDKEDAEDGAEDDVVSVF